ncbi:MAG: hypothetical protein ACI4A7_02505 [Prevotella sp.]
MADFQNKNGWNINYPPLFHHHKSNCKDHFTMLSEYSIGKSGVINWKSINI